MLLDISHKAKMKKSREEKIQDIQSLIDEGYTYTEIAHILNQKYTVLVSRANRSGLKNRNYFKKKKRFSDQFLKDFSKKAKKIGWSRARQENNLTKDQVRRIKVLCYNQGFIEAKNSYRGHDTRRKTPWSGKELVTMLKYCGLIPRTEIMKKMDLNGMIVIKDRLRSLGLVSKNVNGLSFGQFRKLFERKPYTFIKTRAGPTNFTFNIVLWTDIENWISERRIRSIPIMTKYVKSMALFQRWIWGVKDVRSKIKRELNL